MHFLLEYQNQTLKAKIPKKFKANSILIYIQSQHFNISNLKFVICLYSLFCLPSYVSHQAAFRASLNRDRI